MKAIKLVVNGDELDIWIRANGKKYRRSLSKDEVSNFLLTAKHGESYGRKDDKESHRAKKAQRICRVGNIVTKVSRRIRERRTKNQERILEKTKIFDKLE